MRSRRMLAWCVPLGVLIVLAAAVEGSAVFTGPRWRITPGKLAPPAGIPDLPRPTRPPAETHAAIHIPLGAILFWTAVGLVVVLAVLLIMWWRARAPRRRAPSVPAQPAAEPAAEAPLAAIAETQIDVPVIRSGLDEALLSLEQDGEPGDAVVRAWLGLQETAEQSGVARRPSETPTEFTSRILSRVFASRPGANNEAITTLLRLYLRTRFGDHPVTADDVALVRQSLRELAHNWDLSTVQPTQPTRPAGPARGGS